MHVGLGGQAILAGFLDGEEVDVRDGYKCSGISVPGGAEMLIKCTSRTLLRRSPANG